jgi:isoleucyl-tRNA synthetase
MAPILVFTAEEIWKYLPKAQSEHESVHMTMFADEKSLRADLAANKIAIWESWQESAPKS